MRAQYCSWCGRYRRHLRVAVCEWSSARRCVCCVDDRWLRSLSVQEVFESPRAFCVLLLSCGCCWRAGRMWTTASSDSAWRVSAVPGPGAAVGLAPAGGLRSVANAVADVTWTILYGWAVACALCSPPPQMALASGGSGHSCFSWLVLLLPRLRSLLRSMQPPHAWPRHIPQAERRPRRHAVRAGSVLGGERLTSLNRERRSAT